MAFPRPWGLFRRRLVLAVDLVRLLPGGENGGVKPAVFAFLKRMMETEDTRLALVLIANQATRQELKALARPGDIIWCSHQTTADPDPGLGPDPVDTNRLIAAKVGLLYNPFGPDRLSGGRIPFVSLLIDLLHREVPEALPPEEVDYRERFFADVCERAAAIQVISNDVGDRLGTAFGLEASRIFRTYLPPQEISVSGGTNPVGGLAKGRFFMYPANLWFHKNHGRLLVAFRRFLDERSFRDSDWTLVLTGAGQVPGDALDSEVDRLGLKGRVVRAGFLRRADYLACLQGSAGMVYPSLNEGFGIPILEAQHAGIPVACSNLAVLREIADAGAVFFNPRDTQEIAGTMSLLAEAGPGVDEMVRRGRANLRRFDFGAEASHFIEGLVLAARGGTRARR